MTWLPWVANMPDVVLIRFFLGVAWTLEVFAVGTACVRQASGSHKEKHREEDPLHDRLGFLGKNDVNHMYALLKYWCIH